MTFKKNPVSLIIVFCLFCVSAVSGADANNPNLTAVGGEEKKISLGSMDPNTGFDFLMQLTTRGAAIEKVTFSKFTDLNRKNPQPLEILAPAVKPDGSEVLSMENRSLMLPDFGLQLPLNMLQWNALDVVKDNDKTHDFAESRNPRKIGRRGRRIAGTS